MKTGCCNTTHTLQTGAHAICTNPWCENYLGITSVHKNYKTLRNTIALSALTFCLLFTFEDFSMENKEEVPPIPIALPETPADTGSVFQELMKHEVVCPRVVLAQIKIESGNFTSSLFRKTNNMIGMRYPFKRKTKAAGIYIPSKDTVIYGSQMELKKYGKLSNYAVYNSWRDCIADYKLWQESNFNISRHYITFLGNVYAEDPLYVDKIKKAASLK
jgi:hypothetical protein